MDGLCLSNEACDITVTTWVTGFGQTTSQTFRMTCAFLGHNGPMKFCKRDQEDCNVMLDNEKQAVM